MSLFAELKRRHVFRVGAAYLALAWTAIQVVTTVGPMLRFPGWVAPVVFWTSALGLPVVVLLAWAYEWTPDGWRREGTDAANDTVRHGPARRRGRFIVLVALALSAATGVGVWRLAAQRHEPAVLEKDAQPAVANAAAPVERSIAVLPFVDMSATHDQEYFADGISEELLNLLAQVPELRVIARTSSFSFKGKDADIAQIGARLKVTHVLEGSIRKSGDMLRITTQLIRTSDSSHVWSQTYDRRFTDVFAVQDEIASAVVAQLRITLLGDGPHSRKTDSRAYALFLQAREFYRHYNAEAFERAIDLYRRTLDIDPTYAPAWVGLASCYLAQADIGALPIEQGIERGQAAILSALAQDPGSAAAHAQLGLIEGHIKRNYAAAADHLQKALQLEPNNVEALSDASALARRLGRLDLAVALAQRLIELDPVNVDGHDGLALAYRYAGRLDESIATYRLVLSLMPDTAWEHAAIGHALMDQGRAGAALAEFEQEPVEVYRLVGLAGAYHRLDRRAESDTVMATLDRKYADLKPYDVALARTYRGEKELAFAALDRAALRIGDVDLGAIALNPSFAALHDDPRWLPLLRRLGIAPEQLAAVRFEPPSGR